MTKFLLIRHATTDAVGKSLSGRQPGIHLNDQGKLEAAALANRLSDLKITAIYSSPLERAIQTATPLAGLHNLICNVNNYFQELDFGSWTNKPFSELANDQVFKRFNSFRSGTRIPGGEMMQEAQSRIVQGLEKLATNHPGETIAVVSHSDMIKSAVAFYTGMHIDLMQRLEISPASVSVLDVYPDFASLQLLNHCGNL